MLIQENYSNTSGINTTKNNNKYKYSPRLQGNLSSSRLCPDYYTEKLLVPVLIFMWF